MTRSDIAFSFKYDGNVFYSKEHSFTQTPDGMVYTIENGVTVTAKISEYPEHDAFGWVLYFENKSGKNSKVISDICDIDLDLNIKHTPFPRVGYKPVEGNLRVVSMNGNRIRIFRSVSERPPRISQPQRKIERRNTAFL